MSSQSKPDSEPVEEQLGRVPDPPEGAFSRLQERGFFLALVLVEMAWIALIVWALFALIR